MEWSCWAALMVSGSPRYALSYATLHAGRLELPGMDIRAITPRASYSTQVQSGPPKFTATGRPRAPKTNFSTRADPAAEAGSAMDLGRPRWEAGSFSAVHGLSALSVAP